MISDRELDQIRTDAVQLLQSRCEIRRKASVSDGGGSFEDSWSVYARGVPCRLSALSGIAGTSGGRISEDVPHRFWIPANQKVELGDQIVHERRTWEITSLPYRSNFDQFVQQVDVVEVDRQR